MKEYRNFIFLILFNDPVLGIISEVPTCKKQGLQNAFYLLFSNKDLKKKTQNTNHINNLLLLKNSLLLLVLNREGSSKYFLV